MSRGRASSMEADLAAWGKALVLETVGRISGEPRRVTIGFIEDADGTLLVAAGDTDTQWALNLQAQPACHAELNGSRSAFRADPLGEIDKARAVTALILRYGAPAERLGDGPAFRLVPLDA